VQIIPAVDLLGFDATRLEQGDFERELFRTPSEEFVRRVAATRPPLIHLVDLDGARTGQPRLDVLARCIGAAGETPLQISGGVRTLATAEAIFSLGAARVLIGTVAFQDSTTLGTFVEAFGNRLAVTIDVLDGRLKVGGWLDSTPLSVDDAIRHCVDSGVTRILGTAIDRDGTMAGPDLNLYRQLCASPLAVIAAGGIRGQDDADILAAIGCEAAVIGRAFASQFGVNIESL